MTPSRNAKVGKGFAIGDAWIYVLLTLACLVAYTPALRGSFLWDDGLWVYANPMLDDLAGLKRIWTDPAAIGQYYPITVTTFWIEKHLWGLDTLGFHVVNVLLHAFSAFLLMRILKALEIPGALLAAAIFALHPVHVESVAWITERKNVLSGVFYLASVLAYIGFAKGRGRARAVAAVALFLAALLSKSVTASLPVVLGLVLVWKERRLDRRHLPWLGGMLVVGAIKGIVTATLEVREVGARGAEWSLSVLDRVLLAGRIFWFYLGKIVWPHPLSFVYERWTVDAGALVWWVSAVAAMVLLVALWLLRSRIGWGPLVAVLFFGISISPALGFLNVYPMRYSWVADHFQYLSSLGPIVLIAAALARAPRWIAAHALATERSLATPCRAVALAIVAMLGILTWRQAHDYRDLETLWRSTIAKSPTAWMPRYNLGKMLAERGDTDEAELLFETTLALKPDHVDAYTEIANILLSRGDPAGAVAMYERGLAIDPTYAVGHFNLGIALEAAHDLAGAEAAYRESIENADTLEGRYRGARGPLPWRAHLNLARLLESRGRHDEAIAEYRRSAEANPEAAEPLVDLGSLLATEGRLDLAADAFRRAGRADPRSATAPYNLGVVLERLGDVQGAIAAYRNAVAVDPALAPAWGSLANALLAVGDDLGAREAAAKAARLGLRPPPEFLEALGRAGRASEDR